MTLIPDNVLLRFVTESNAIENITREPTEAEIETHMQIIESPRLAIEDLTVFVSTVASAPIRAHSHMNVRVGRHVAPRGGDQIVDALEFLLEEAHQFDPWTLHNLYMWLHPYMDGNGRSGRVLWLRHMIASGQLRKVEAYGFLRAYYYQTLTEQDAATGKLWDKLGWNFI